MMKCVYLKGSDQALPITNIFCIGRNYAAHIAELNNRHEEHPLVFLKPTSALHLEGTPIVLPPFSNDIHYETELVLLIREGGKNIPQKEALAHIGAYGIGLDLTARDWQTTAKERGLPWASAKGFDYSACVSRFIAAEDFLHPEACSFEMKLNQQVRQQGNTACMIFSISYLIAYLSQIFTLSAGDLIFTGTPEGVGQLHGGDQIELSLANQLHAQFSIAGEEKT